MRELMINFFYKEPVENYLSNFVLFSLKVSVFSVSSSFSAMAESISKEICLLTQLIFYKIFCKT